MWTPGGGQSAGDVALKPRHIVTYPLFNPTPLWTPFDGLDFNPLFSCVQIPLQMATSGAGTDAPPAQFGVWLAYTCMGMSAQL